MFDKCWALALLERSEEPLRLVRTSRRPTKPDPMAADNHQVVYRAIRFTSLFLPSGGRSLWRRLRIVWVVRPTYHRSHGKSRLPVHAHVTDLNQSCRRPSCLGLVGQPSSNGFPTAVLLWLRPCESCEVLAGSDSLKKGIGKLSANQSRLLVSGCRRHAAFDRARTNNVTLYLRANMQAA